MLNANRRGVVKASHRPRRRRSHFHQWHRQFQGALQALRRTLRLVRKVLQELMMILLIVYTLSRLIARIFD